MFKLTSIKSVITLGLFFIIGFSSMGNAETTVSAEVQYIFNTFSFLVCGFLVMWMAAAFVWVWQNITFCVFWILKGNFL